MLTYFFARSAKKILGVCVFLRWNLRVLRAKRAENFWGFSRVNLCFWYFFRATREENFGIFKGKLRFLALFARSAKKILGYPVGSLAGTPKTPPVVKPRFDAEGGGFDLRFPWSLQFHATNPPLVADGYKTMGGVCCESGQNPQIFRFC